MTPERYRKLRSILDRRQPDLTVVTDDVHKSRNLSAIVRTADAVGVGDVHFVIGDKDYNAFRGTALGSHRYVNVHRHHQLPSPLDMLKQQGYQIVAAHLSTDAVDYHEVDYARPTALLLGAEREGISELASQLADVHITIPMVGMVESFNVSVAAGIILNEARHQRQQQGLYEQQRIDQQHYEQLLFEWAHPKVSEFCRSNNLAYPPLLADGEIENPSQWYADMRDYITERTPV